MKITETAPCYGEGNYSPSIFTCVLFTSKTRSFDLVRKVSSEKGKAASLLNQNRFRHLSFSQTADTYEA